MTLISALRTAAAALFVASLVVLFGTVSLRWLVGDVGWYGSNFEKNRVAATTGVSGSELMASAEKISSYLLLRRDRVDDIEVDARGQRQPLFSSRENLHMKDVQALLRGFFGLQLAVGGYALLYLAALLGWRRDSFRRTLGTQFRLAGMLTLGLFGLFGVLSLVDFDALFLQFHLISFDNDLWQLDPTRDRLVMMFPQQFWYDSTLRLAAATAAQALAAVAAGTFMVGVGENLAGQPLKGRSTDNTV